MSFRIGEAFVEVTAEDSTSEGTAGIGRKLTGWVAGLGLGALIGKSLSDGLSIETGRVSLQNELGLTAEDARTYGDAAGTLYRDNFGSSMEEVTSVIGVVGDAMGGLGTVTSDEVSAMTGNVLTLASTFDLEATSSVSALQSAVANGLVPSMENATDIATRVFQEGGPKAREFLDVLNEYGPNLSSAGISMEQFGGMAVSYLDAGGFSVDQFADSIREMTIRVSDGTAASSGAFDTLGMDAETMTARMAAGGPTAQAAFSEIVAGLSGMTDPVAQNTAGAQLFGSMWEDSSGAILAGLSPLPDALGTVDGATQDMADNMGETGQAKIDTMKRQLEGLLVGAADLPGPLGAVGAAVNAVGIESVIAGAGTTAMVASFVAENTELLGSVAKWTAKTVAMGASAIATGAITAATGVATAAQWLWNAALSANPIALIVIAIAALVAGLVWFFTQTEAGQAIIEAVWGAIQTAIGATVSWITDTVVPMLVGAWEWITSSVTTLGTNISNVWNSITGWISSAASSIWGTVQSIFGAVVSFLSGAWNGILGTVRSVWGGITGFISGAINGVISTVQGLPGQILSVFSGAGSLLLSAGRNVVTGLWNGISGAASWLWGRVRSWAGGIVDNVLGALGINSPSRVMRDKVGRWIPAGVADGMTENMGPIESAVSSMTGALTDVPSGAFDAGLVGRSGATGLVSTNSAGSAVSIGSLTLQVEGKFDFSNPIEWERFITAVRDGLVNVERAYS